MAICISKKPFGELSAFNSLTDLSNFGEFPPNLIAPDYFNFYNSLQHRPNSLPGPDCISLAGWKAAGDPGIACMQKVDCLLREGHLPPVGDDYNDSIMAFLVKGEKADDAVAVNRDAMEMRPLSMKNSFNKVIVAANCNALNSEYAEITHETQNGFTGGRNFIKHIVANDSAGRMYSCAYEGSKKTFLVPSTLQISAAFGFFNCVSLSNPCLDLGGFDR